MATKPDRHEVVRFLSTDPEPLWLLEYLRDEPAPLEDIAEGLALPQSTLQSPLDALVERQWAERTSEGYRITTFGGFVAMEYLTFLDTLEQIADSEQFIQELPLEAISLLHSRSQVIEPSNGPQ